MIYNSFCTIWEKTLVLLFHDSFRRSHPVFENAQCTFDAGAVLAIGSELKGVLVFEHFGASYGPFVRVFAILVVDAHVGDQDLLFHADGAHALLQKVCVPPL